MKVFLILIQLLTFSQVAFANDVLKNCFVEGGADYFTYLLENSAKKKLTQVLLLNKKKEVVGVLSVKPKRAEKYPYSATVVAVKGLVLCSPILNVSVFYYADDSASNLMDWEKSGTVAMTTDEGMIELSTSLVLKEGDTSFYKVMFKGYDVFDEADDNDGWGAPKGVGEFYFYMPSNWIVADL